MGGEASGGDHDLLDKFLNVVLDRYKDGVISHASAHSALIGVLQGTANPDASVTRHMKAFLDHNPRDDL